MLALSEHWLERYGKDNISQWYIEGDYNTTYTVWEIIEVYVVYVHSLVWNEPNLITLAGGFWDGSQVQSL